MEACFSRTGTGPYVAAPPRYAWALLHARIHEVFPLLCPKCGGELRILAFIPDDSTVRDILAHLGEPTALPPDRAHPRPAALDP